MLYKAIHLWCFNFATNQNVSTGAVSSWLKSQICNVCDIHQVSTVQELNKHFELFYSTWGLCFFIFYGGNHSSINGFTNFWGKKNKKYIALVLVLHQG